ncbi:sensor histidine kinase [Paraburkholderia hospita]|uniref:sensor histidine kinase n=1 Tax=Paraburkholderia hospita TaxID=169430 RepID=UPI0013FDA639|nr:HAMP domain-containing sensor histidine kinase [Paraburkholderia hospita]
MLFTRRNLGINMSLLPAFVLPSIGARAFSPADSTKAIVGCPPAPAIISPSSRPQPAFGKRKAPNVTDEILAIVAHELRGPLTPLRLAVQVIRRTSPDQPDVIRMIETVERQVDAIARLADDLMDATRVGQGALRMVKREVGLMEFLADPLDAAALATAARDQTLTVVIPDRTLRIECDPVRLSQAVNNLLHNAVKYTPRGGHIRVTALAEDQSLVLSVSDDGPGISSVLLPHIFDLFAQSTRTIAASAGGLGIGLAVVSAIAEAHGGTALAASAGPDAGSEFTVRLPVGKLSRESDCA